VESRNVLICPLDWGIGHATRCVPVIRKFREAGYTVVLAADDRPYEFLRKEFPELRMIRLPGTPVSYPRSNRFTLKIAGFVPRFLLGIRKENRMLAKILSGEKFDVVVSDNRYGLYSTRCPSILITHQLDIQVPRAMRFLQPLLRRMIYRTVGRFTECWVPDFGMHFSLAGLLSHPPVLPPNTHYIGPLSRFSPESPVIRPGSTPVYDIMVILSGPEPQRTIFEEIILTQLKKSTLTGIVLRGRTEEEGSHQLTEGITVFNHLDTESMAECIRNSWMIVSRPGYSTVMDIVTLGKRAIFVPTPGQTEQEYLSRYLMEKKIFFSMDQEHFDLLFAMEMSNNYHGMVLTNDYTALMERISSLKKSSTSPPGPLS
jgi:uncharacterized protein (TIGR00661 family)